MTAAVAAPHRPTPTTTVLVGVVAALGCGLLAARPALLASARQPAVALAVVFAVLLIVGALVPLPVAPPAITRSTARHRHHDCRGRRRLRAPLGCSSADAPRPASPSPCVAANILAAVAEEAWFRRVCFGLLAPAGSIIAVAGSTTLFALVHVSTYGFWILPLDLAAGALLGWQRAVSGSWGASAVTHAIGNVLVLL